MNSRDFSDPRELSAWSLSVDDVLQALRVNPDCGLGTDEVLKRRRTWGRNQLQATRPRHSLSILASQFKGVVVMLLLAAGGAALLFSEVAEGLAIFAVIVINATFGFVTEWRAIRSMEALRAFARVECVLLRNSETARAAAEELVPGDIVMFEAGDLVPADIRLIEAAKFTADESTLTGESLPVRKDTAVLSEETPMLDRHNMAYKGTTIARGSGKGVVVSTGINTEFGKVFEHVAVAKSSQTPLEKRLSALGARLAWWIIGIAVLVAAAGILAGRELYLAIEVAIALSVAAIPEGLAIVATIALARGMWRLARRNALITRLSAVETLGATSVILTDKTGTLTENRMAVSTVLLADADVEVVGAETADSGEFRIGSEPLDAKHAQGLDELLKAASYCNNASLDRTSKSASHGVGDPTELALLWVASARNIWRQELLEHAPEIHEDPFDPDSKRMATLHRQDSQVLVAVKGAPEAILPGCIAVKSGNDEVPLSTPERQRWLARANDIGKKGLRTLAIAQKSCASESIDPYTELLLLGIVGLEDPARAGIDDAIRHCHRAGISVVMVTGDHAATAKNIAIETGIVDQSADSEGFLDGATVDQLFEGRRDDVLLGARVFSRVTPEQKLKLIDLYQRSGHAVAMTGDGVNDAPALKKADIGIAMGLRGTAVAKEAAVMVLQDDEFSTIVAAVAHGRAIFANIRKFVVYLLSCNASEVLVVSLATVAGAPLPLLPLQILFLNLVTDVFPALALGVGHGSSQLMTQRPRSTKEPILTGVHWTQIAVYGAILASSVLAAMALSIYLLGFDHRQAVAVSFCTLALAQMWHVFNMRDEASRLFNNEITRNSWIWVALAVCLALVLAAIYVPGLSEVLSLTDPGLSGWAIIIPASVVPLFVGPILLAAVGAVRARR